MSALLGFYAVRCVRIVIRTGFIHYSECFPMLVQFLAHALKRNIKSGMTLCRVIMPLLCCLFYPFFLNGYQKPK